MIEKIILDYLSGELSPLPVFMETPAGTPEDPIPEEYVLIEKTGSSETNLIPSAVFAFQSVSSKSLYRAAEINEDVKGAMFTVRALPEVSRAQLNSDYNFTDTRTKQYRYQAVYDITYKEV